MCGLFGGGAAKAAAPAVIPVTQWLVSIGIFVVCGCASVFLIAWTLVAGVRTKASLGTPLARSRFASSVFHTHSLTCPDYNTCNQSPAPCTRRVLTPVAASAQAEAIMRMIWRCPPRFVLLQKLRQTARHVDRTLDTISEHLPTVASSVNLTGLELADCIVEFSNLSQEVTGGLKAGVRSVRASEQTLRSGGAALRKAIKDVVWPGVKERAKATGGALHPAALVVLLQC
jgi:hypothetical protein